MPTLLLVEDDEFLSDTMKAYLEWKQYAIDRAFEGQEALDKMQHGTYDLIILDWHLPGMSGLEICRSYRQRGGQLPVLMLTGKSDPQAAAEATGAGASAYLLKPFKLDQLEAELSKFLPKTE